MSRLTEILKDTKLYKTFSYAFAQYDKSFDLKRGTARKQAAEDLGLKDTNILNKYFDESSTKYLRIEELFIIIGSLDKPQQKIILDYICNKYDFQCLDTAETKESNQSLETLLLSVTATNGDLSKKFIESMEDGQISEQEEQGLNSIAYQLRSLLRTFEARIKANHD